MRQVRKSGDRGYFDHGWLKSFHTFSFGHYVDREQMGFRALRVINEDFVAPGKGFGMHPHRDMEIVTIVLEGALEHRDSLGHGEVLRPGDVQRMSAGTGIRHSEFNPSATEAVHLYQIWLHPQQEDLAPSYEQRFFNAEERRGQWQLIASPAPQNHELMIQQDARLMLAQLDSNSSLASPLPPGRNGWLQVLRGNVLLDNLPINTGDGVALLDDSAWTLTSKDGADVLLFDLA